MLRFYTIGIFFSLVKAFKNNKNLLLCMLFPDMKLPQSVPRIVNIYLAMSTFSNPLSPLTLEGMPCLSVAFLKAENAVDARLFFAEFNHITFLE